MLDFTSAVHYNKSDADMHRSEEKSVGPEGYITRKY